jgi:heme/copper-type cytochrome/quinol oxidase subunit 2
MDTVSIGRTLGHGALAGVVAGGAGAATMYWLVEPLIRAAIAIEEAGSEPEAHAGHAQAAGEVVTRGEQVSFGLATVVLVGILIGIAFALVHRFLRARLPGSSPAASVMALAGLGFVSFTLAPAIVIPANPPAVGDPMTVDARTLTYLGAIVGAVVLTAAVTGVARAKNLTHGARAVAATTLGIAGTAVLLWALPDVADPVPAAVPADLIWHFRVASLAQIGVMWLVLGAVFAFLTSARPRLAPASHASPRSAAQVR